MATALRIQGVWKSYVAGVRGCSARVWALRGCSLDVGQGDRIGLVGRRGAGKTTLLRCLAGHYPVDAGRIETSLAGAYLSCRDDLLHLPTDLAASRMMALVDFASGTHGSHDPGALLAAFRMLSPFTGALIISALDAASVAPLVDRVVVMREGRLVELLHVPIRRVAERTPPTGGTQSPAPCWSAGIR